MELMEKKELCWVSWTNLSKPKASGWLGFRDIQAFNQALLAKIAWRMISAPSCLLSRILSGKYCHKGSFLTITPPDSCSYGWRGILHCRDLLIQNLGKSIENGLTTRIWHDSWIFPHEKIKPCGPLLENARDLRVSYLLIDDLKWNKNLLQELLPKFDSQFQCLRPSQEGVEDVFIWQPASFDIYSTKSGYHSAMTPVPQVPNARNIPPTENLLPIDRYKYVWSKYCTPKLKVFLWSILQKSLPIGGNLQRRGIIPEILCPRCGNRETTMHIFSSCSFARKFWSLIPLKNVVHLATLDSFEKVEIASRSFICHPPSGISTNILSRVC